MQVRSLLIAVSLMLCLGNALACCHMGGSIKNDSSVPMMLAGSSVHGNTYFNGEKAPTKPKYLVLPFAANGVVSFEQTTHHGKGEGGFGVVMPLESTPCIEVGWEIISFPEAAGVKIVKNACPGLIAKQMAGSSEIDIVPSS